MDYIENRTFDEIQIGDTASLERTLTRKDIDLFAVMSGDVNPAHVDEEFARSDIFKELIAHGMWGGALISTLLGTKLPGPGTIYLGQTLRFRRPVTLGDKITVSVRATAKEEQKRRVTFDCQCVNQHGEIVISGMAEVMAPGEKIKRPRVIMPDIQFQNHGQKHRELIASTEGLEPVRTAVIYPVGKHSLLGAIDAAQANLIHPVLIGPAEKMRSVAHSEGLDIASFELIDVAQSQQAAAYGVDMAQAGKVEALLAGTLPAEELMQRVTARESGLTTERRMSHVFAIDVSSYPRLMFITDAGINIYPGLEEKRDIVQNAIDLAQTLGIMVPKVAILSSVERVKSRIRSTLEAAALCKMVDRGQITGGVVDGPLGFDSAVSEDAARIKGIVSPVAGQADILVVPDLESGTMLVKQQEYMAEARSAGVVIGARVPIALTYRSSHPLGIMASCALALLLARREQPPHTEIGIEELLIH